MEDKVLNAALAGLLHDVGKIEQRARSDPWMPAPGKEIEGQPVHATWSIDFIQAYVPEPFRAAALAGAYHHAPDRSPAQDHSLSELISLADKLSAGERADVLEKKERPPKHLVTIFDRIELGKHVKQEGWHYLPLSRLSLKRNAIYPIQPIEKVEEENAYVALRDLMRTVAGQASQDKQAYVENLLFGLQQMAWAVPSAYYHSVPDVSLYDHSRMTAALAVCLAHLPSERIRAILSAVTHEFQEKASAEEKKLLDEPLVYLVGGDISGIQDFIYTISSKGAARTLRGRSFYLQLLTEAVLRYLLRELGLPYTNVIYSGGGHFYLLAPLNTEDNMTKIRRTITEKLLLHHGLSLYLAVGYAPVPASGFKIGKFPDFWGRMHAEVARKKQQRYTELGEDFNSRIFSIPEKGGNPDDTCSVCGEDLRKVRAWDEEREEQARICTLCESFVNDLGKPLPEARFVALGWSQPEDTQPSTAGDVLKSFGLDVQYLHNDKQPANIPGAERITLWALGDPEGDRWPDAGNIPSANLLRYTVNHIPRSRDGQPLTFNDLQDKVAGGFKRLGVLRMDVDDLGDVFKNGLGENATLARLSTLSFQMSLYFEGWVKQICEMDTYKNLVYAVYAGGDDVFLIGPWDKMPDLAVQIRDDFAGYTAQHPGLHLSAGMSFISGKYPIYQAADDAQKALSSAKDYPGKNAFSFLGQVWSWTAFSGVAEKQKRVRRVITGEEDELEGLQGPQAVIHILRQLSEDEADLAKRKGGRPVWGPWMWRGAYLLTRMAERYKKSRPDLEKAILAIRDELNANEYQEINQWGAASRWTQLETRKKRQEDQR